MSTTQDFEVVVVRVINDVRHTTAIGADDFEVGTDASVCSIGNGNAVVAYALETSSNSALKLAIWERNDLSLGGTFIGDQRGSINRNPSVVDTPGAGFGIAYETDSQSDSLDIVFSLFSETGTRLATFDISNPSFASHGFDETNATATMVTDTLVAITYTQRSTATRDEPPMTKVVLFNLETNTNVASLTISSLTLTSSINPFVVGLENGHIALFATNTSTSSDGFGRLLGAERTQTSDAGSDLMTGDALRDHMFGGDGSDTLIGGEGAADDLHGGLANDVFRLGTGDVALGEVIAGDEGADRIDIAGRVHLDLATISLIEKLKFVGTGIREATFGAAQFGNGCIGPWHRCLRPTGSKRPHHHQHGFGQCSEPAEPELLGLAGQWHGLGPDRHCRRCR